MSSALHLLSIGSQESNDSIRDLLLSKQMKCQLLAATDPRDLLGFLTSSIDVAILHQTLTANALRECSSRIRQHWPQAKILLVYREANILDDPLYDERIWPGSSQDALLAIIERAASAMRKVDMR